MFAKKQYYYNRNGSDPVQTHTLSNIAFNSGGLSGIVWNDFKPSVGLLAIIEAIEGVDSVNAWFVSEQNEASKADDPTASVVGLDSFGDIVIGKGELPLIRGGWTDRNGAFYEDSTNDRKPSSINMSPRSRRARAYPV